MHLYTQCLWASPNKCSSSSTSLDLLSEDISENPADHGDDGEEEEEDEVGEEEALDLLDGGEPTEAREEDHQDGGDEDGVGGVHVQPVPEKLLQEGFVMHGPEAEC